LSLLKRPPKGLTTITVVFWAAARQYVTETEGSRIDVKRLTGLGLAVFCLLWGGVLYGASLEEGFLGVNWGESITQVEGLSELHQRDKVSYFARTDVTYRLKGRYPSRVVYGFYLDRFFAGYISFNSWEALSEIRQEITSLYGTPKIKVRKDHSVYQWKAGKIKIKLKLWELKGEMKLAFYYVPLSGQVNEETQEENFEYSLRVLPLDRNRKYEAIPLIIF